MTIQEKFEAGLAALFTLSGLVFLLYPRISADAILIGAALMASASGLLLLWQAVRHRHLMDFLKAAGTFLLAGFFWSFRAVGVRFVCLVFSLYMLFTAVILAIEAFMDLHEKSKTGWAILVVAAGDLALSLFGFFFYKRDPALLSRLTGIYLIWQGVQMIVEIFAFRHHRGSRAWAIRYISSLPVYLVAAAPSLILRFLYKRNMDQAAFTSREPKNSDPVNLRVFVHSGLKGEQQFGHMTIAYKGVMFSYGNYDAAQEKLFRTFGPGILFTVPAEIYVNNCCVYEGSTLLNTGSTLTENRKKNWNLCSGRSLPERTAGTVRCLRNSRIMNAFRNTKRTTLPGWNTVQEPSSTSSIPESGKRTGYSAGTALCLLLNCFMRSIPKL